MEPSARHRKVFAFVGANLKTHRRRAGLTQERLAERAGIDVTYVQSIERGATNFTLDVLCDLADAVGADPGGLFETVAVEARKPGRPPKARTAGKRGS